MASNLLVMASKLLAMASNLIAIASNLTANHMNHIRPCFLDLFAWSLSLSLSLISLSLSASISCRTMSFRFLSGSLLLLGSHMLQGWLQAIHGVGGSL